MLFNSTLQSLAIQGVNELALHIGLPPPIANSLSLIAGTLAGTITDPSSLPQAFQTLVPTLAQELTISGVTALGQVFGEIRATPDGRLQFINNNIGITGSITSDGRLTFSFHNPGIDDFAGLIHRFNSASLDDKQKGEFYVFSIGNGFWNTRNNEDFAPQLSIDFINDITQDQIASGHPPVVLLRADGTIAKDKAGNVLTTASLPLTLYEKTSLVGNALQWACEQWFGCTSLSEELSAELTDYFNLVNLNVTQYGLDPSKVVLTHFAHSGNLMPMLKALEQNPNIPIKTLMTFETSYLGDGIIRNRNIERMIQVRGTRTLFGGDVGPPFLQFNEFKGIDQNGNPKAIENYYIEILGAGHSGFDRNKNPQANLFMRELSLKANDSTKLNDFLNVDRPDGSIKLVNGVYVIDPSKFHSELEQP